MKKVSSLMKAGAVAILVVALTTFTQAGIDGTGHDFELASWNTANKEICQPCHTPHTGDMAGAPLWNHEETAAAYTKYTGFALDATDVDQPAGVSKQCLGCHDGSVALDNFGGASPDTTFMSGSALLDTDLSDDHPVSFTYNPGSGAGLDADLYASSTASGLGGTIAQDMLAGGTEVECSSCHDPHGGVAGTAMLHKDNEGSALCLTCHNK